MTDFSPFISNDVPNPQEGYSNASLSDLAISGIKSGLQNTSLGLLSSLDAYNNPNGLIPTLSKQEFDAAGYNDYGLSYQPGMTHQSVQATLEAQRDRRLESDLLSHATTSGYLVNLGGQLAGGLVDPLNLVGAGEGLEAMTFGRAVVRGMAANAALAVPTVAGGAYLGSLQQMPESAGALATQFAMVTTIGGLVGAAGFGVSRLGERLRGMDVGYRYDENGHVVLSTPDPINLPPDIPRNAVDPDTVALQNFARQDTTNVEPTVTPSRKPVAQMTDEEFKAQFVSKDNPRPAEVIKDANGNRSLIDPETGEILSNDRIESPTVPVSPENQALAQELQAKLKGAVFETEPRGGAKPVKPSRESAGSYELRQDIVDNTLRDAADNSVPSAVRPGENEEPGGVLQPRGSRDHLGEVKEVPLREFYSDALRSSTIFGLDAKSFRQGNIRAEPMLHKLEVLNRDQWDYVTDWVATTPMLKYLAKGNNIDFNATVSKRELGDLLWDAMHSGNRDRPIVALKSRPEQYEVPEAIDLDAEEIAARIRESDALDGYTRTDDIADIQAGLKDVTPENIETELSKFAELQSLEELAKSSPDVKEVLEYAQALKNKKSALADALLCLIGAE